MSSPLTPPAPQIDPRGQRFGAGLSPVVLVTAISLSRPWLARLVRRADELVGPVGVPSISYRER